MQERVLGRSGLRVSIVGLGCNNFTSRIDLEGTRAVVHKALDLGVTLLDTSDRYGKPPGGSEEAIGQILGDRRKNVVLATKFGNYNDPVTGAFKGLTSRRHIMSSVEASLKRLRTDWIDLFQIHRPDEITPNEETLRSLDDLVRQGKIRYAGACNQVPWEVVDAHWTARHHNLNPLISAQNQYSLLFREAEHELLGVIERCGMGFLPYLPLASGLLTGKYRQGHIPLGSRLSDPRPTDAPFLSDSNWPVVERLRAFCEERGHSLLELAFGWLLSRPVVTSVIAGATSPEQLEQNVRAIGWRLTSEELAEAERLAPAQRSAS
jgi:aryl-alcohol dehydrogenase-like predicted oxidoreductase